MYISFQAQYGIDWAGPYVRDLNSDGVHVPGTNCPLSEQQLTELTEVVYS